jgi:type IV secretory pathway TrbD component
MQSSEQPRPSPNIAAAPASSHRLLMVGNPDWLGVFYIIAKDRPNAWGNAHDHAERQAVVDRMDPATRERAWVHGQFESPIEYTTAARAVMLLFGMLAVVLVFVLSALYTGRLIAFVAAVLFALHPAVSEAYTTVGVDVLVLAFSLLAVVHFVLIERCVWRRSARPSLAGDRLSGWLRRRTSAALGNTSTAALS